MGVTKKTVSMDEHVVTRIEAAARESGVSFSTWLTSAAERRLRLHDGLRGVDEWEDEAGALTRDERAAGEALLDRLLAAGEAGHG